MPAKATSSRKTHIVRQLNPHGSCQSFVFVLVFGAAPTQLEQGWLLKLVPCRCWRFAGMEQPLPAEHNSKRMFLRLLWNPFEVASQRIAQHEPQSAHECNTMLRQEECGSLHLPFSPVPCTTTDEPQTSPNMLQACAPWFWSLNAPLLLRAQPVQRERTFVPVY